MRNFVPNIGSMAYKAIIAGSSGLIGSNLLNLLLTHPDFSEIITLVRKPSSITHAKLSEVVIDFNELTEYSSQLTGNVVFCCLGTTLKQTPDLEDYRKIDHDYPVELAKTAFKNNIAQYHFVSSMGANASSRTFYTKLKGETEIDLKSLKINSLHIYRPSLLDGDRKENRLFEKIAIQLMRMINPLLTGSMKKYRSIAVGKVASAMLNQSLKNITGRFTYTSDQIEELA